MPSARRDFLTQLLATGAFSGIFASPAAAKGVAELFAQAAKSPQKGGISEKQAEFWTAFADSTGVPATPLGGFQPRGKSGGGADPGRAPHFFNFNKNAGFRALPDIHDSELLQHDGDVTVGLNVAGFKASEDDKKIFENLQSSQLRIDLLQNKSVLPFLDPMAWTAIAAMFPKMNGKMPKLEDTSFDPGSTWQHMQNMPLPGGTGRWAFNFSVHSKESALSQILKIASTEIGRFAPVVGLPAISVGALSAFTSFYAMIHPAGTTSIFQHMPVDVFATGPAWKNQASSVGLPLLSGDYVLVPRNQLDRINSHLGDLELQQGFVVPKGTSANDVFTVAADPSKVPDVTYVTVTAQVRPAELIPGSKPTDDTKKSSGA
jgi:hypothetical protein